MSTAGSANSKLAQKRPPQPKRFVWLLLRDDSPFLVECFYRRLRGLLKTTLRRFGFRAVDIGSDRELRTMRDEREYLAFKKWIEAGHKKGE